MRPVFDDRDAAILEQRTIAYDKRQGPRVGDFVIFADGVTRRVSYIWDWDSDDDTSVQTSDGGSYYLGDGYVSMSGGLYIGVPGKSLTLTDEVRDGRAWFFHHDYHTAHNGVDVSLPFRVFTCDRVASNV